MALDLLSFLRLKSVYTSDRIEDIKGFREEIREAFNRIRIEYGADEEVQP